MTAGIFLISPGSNVMTIYPLENNGDVTPSATIEGPATELNVPFGIAVDSGGNIYVANNGSSDGGIEPSLSIHLAAMAT